MRALLYVAVLIVALLAVPSAVTAAQRCESPPGTAGVDEYCESIPGPGGNGGSGGQGGSPSDGGSSGGSGVAPGGGSGGSSGGGVSDATRQSLQGLGPDGLAVLGLAGSAPVATDDGAELDPATGGGGRAGNSDASPDGGEVNVVSDEAVPSDNPLAALTSAIDDGATSGNVFPWVLILVGLLLAAIAWLRYRRTERGSA